MSANRESEGMVIDLLVVNDTEVILIEYKFKKLFPKYADVKAMVAIAAILLKKRSLITLCKKDFI
ncbi:hypothetical protein CCP3SC5AM1_1560002 [Gammaproteobacteria bacterium]